MSESNRRTCLRCELPLATADTLDYLNPSYCWSEVDPSGEEGVACSVRHWKRRAMVAEARLAAVQEALTVTPPKEPIPTTTHILRYGLTLCRMQGLPNEWPEGHKWISLFDEEHAQKANCGRCLLEKDRLGV